MKKKIKIWKSTYADTKFRELIKIRDGACVRCKGYNFLGVSHFIGRTISSTRYWPDNCVLLCAACHTGQEGWEHRKGTDYREFMVERLGEEGFKNLKHRANKFTQRQDAIKEFMEFYELRKTHASTSKRDNVSRT